GREYDSESGLQFNRARYYDPRTGRWTSLDPIEFVAADMNLYRYAGNGTTNATDPDGLLSVPQSVLYKRMFAAMQAQIRTWNWWHFFGKPNATIPYRRLQLL